jgi:hypothetical protein
MGEPFFDGRPQIQRYESNFPLPELAPSELSERLVVGNVYDPAAD